ncbi:MAG: succinate dehydrogenase [Acidobacteria bacterium RIFCSPLOWO2_12_FULL_65_11]|nr:MAG: succinate dehydrogenase [Acidobacteria bacterium RIFCSPLOWO2_02_FULL_64_15]OFW33415.1 MAG: succinate dehydrogenase [Acidobacteria bacterium RIFCSPLOWO2_12_FULL_65_11]
MEEKGRVSVADAAQPLVLRRFGETRRSDAWWLTPLAVFCGFSAFIIYSTWAAFQNANYTFGPYLSPFYSPEIFGDSPHAWFGPKPAAWPDWLPFSPALLILPIPGLFRFTCYYYRGAYYKAFWMDPVSCAVGEPRKSYWGEHSFPLILQNLHRYVLMLVMLVLGILAYDAWKGLWFTDPATGTVSFGIGVGSLILVVNVVLISSYTFGCHSMRHFVGGCRDLLSRAPLGTKTYDCVSCLNRRHMLWAWCSLVSVGFSDLYVRMCAMGIWSDFRFL